MKSNTEKREEKRRERTYQTSLVTKFNVGHRATSLLLLAVFREQRDNKQRFLTCSKHFSFILPPEYLSLLFPFHTILPFIFRVSHPLVFFLSHRLLTFSIEKKIYDQQFSALVSVHCRKSAKRFFKRK